MKYPPLEEPCKSCLYMCFRVEEPTFTGDKNCKYARSIGEESRNKIKQILGVQEKINEI